MFSSNIIKHAIPLIPTHGFTRKTLSLAAITLHGSLSKPLADSAINSLFGVGDRARIALIDGWLEEGRRDMGQLPDAGPHSVSGLLKRRLRWNEPVLPYLSEASDYIL